MELIRRSSRDVSRLNEDEQSKQIQQNTKERKSNNNLKGVIRMQDLLESVDKMANIRPIKHKSRICKIDVNGQLKPNNLLDKSIELTQFLENEQSLSKGVKSRVVKINQSSLPSFHKKKNKAHSPDEVLITTEGHFKVPEWK